jgi:hypothetical protein
MPLCIQVDYIGIHFLEVMQIGLVELKYPNATVQELLVVGSAEKRTEISL